MDKQGRGLSETVWTRLDRKAGAITELTVRQLRHRMSTWVVLGVGTLLILMLLAFYVDAVRDGFEPIDNDGDSEDWDGDGYPLGQERKYGTEDWDSMQYPGSGYYVRDGEVHWSDQNRTHSGNQTWIDATGIFSPIWIDEDFQYNQWDDVDLSDLDECTQNGEFGVDWWISWGDACQQSNGDIALMSVNFRGEGTLRVLEEYYSEWGHFTDQYYVEPEPASNYIDEDDIDWDGNILSSSQGFDDDGDCLRVDWIELDFWFEQDDSNRNGIPCDVVWIIGSDGETIIDIRADENVDEDPDDEKLSGESIHRVFIIAVGKIAFIMILSIFLPLFLALGLVRDETENGTLHYLLSKPIHRGEFIVYRILGYLLIAGSFVLLMSFLMGIFTSLLGPGDSIIRFRDILIWFAIGLTTVLALTAYGAVFNTLGLVSPKYGVYIALIIGVWEFMMAVLTLIGGGSTTIQYASSLSISHWALQLVDSLVLIIWPDTLTMHLMAEAFNLDSGLDVIWSPPAHTLETGNPYVSAIISVVILSLITTLMIFMAQSIFKRREIM